MKISIVAICFLRKCPHLPKIPRPGRGFLKPKYKVKTEGVGTKPRKPSAGGVWIFSITQIIFEIGVVLRCFLSGFEKRIGLHTTGKLF